MKQSKCETANKNKNDDNNINESSTQLRNIEQIHFKRMYGVHCTQIRTNYAWIGFLTTNSSIFDGARLPTLTRNCFFCLFCCRSGIFLNADRHKPTSQLKWWWYGEMMYFFYVCHHIVVNNSIFRELYTKW